MASTAKAGTPVAGPPSASKAPKEGDIAVPAPIVSPPSASLETQMLRRQVQCLQSENANLKKEISQLRKRASSASVSGAPPAKKARTAGQRKKLFEKWAKGIARESKKHKINNAWGCEPYSVTVKDVGVWSVADFDEIFSGSGTKIQPTPSNKPTSVITILRFDGYDAVKGFFADGGAVVAQGGYEAQIWRQRSFSKSFKCRDAPTSLTGMDVHYNKSKQALSFEFAMQLEDEDY